MPDIVSMFEAHYFSLSGCLGVNSGGLASPLKPPHLRQRAACPCPEGRVACQRHDGLGLRALCKNRGGMLKAAGVYSLRGSESKGNSPLQEHTPVARVMQRKLEAQSPTILFVVPAARSRRNGGIFYIDCRSGHTSLRCIASGGEKGF